MKEAEFPSCAIHWTERYGNKINIFNGQIYYKMFTRLSTTLHAAGGRCDEDDDDQTTSAAKQIPIATQSVGGAKAQKKSS